MAVNLSLFIASVNRRRPTTTPPRTLGRFILRAMTSVNRPFECPAAATANPVQLDAAPKVSLHLEIDPDGKLEGARPARSENPSCSLYS
jgi:hypothetical protein